MIRHLLSAGVVAAGLMAYPFVASADAPAERKQALCPTEGKGAVLCTAFYEATGAAWKGGSASPPAGYEVHPFYEEWAKAPGHLRYRDEDTYILFFTTDGNPIEPLPQIDEKDKVVLVVFSAGLEDVATANTVESVTVTTCNAPVPFRIAGSVKASPVVERNGLHANRLTSPPPKFDPRPYYQIRITQNCRSEDGIKLNATVRPPGTQKPAAQTVTLTPIPTLSIFNFTIGLGFVYDFSQTTEYRAASVKGQNVPVLVEDKHMEGMVPGIAFVSWRPAGVDTQRTRWPGTCGWRCFGEWWGVSLGFQLTDPLHHLYVGGIMEPYPGFALTAGAHFRAVNNLGGGYQVGDRFPGGGEVPIDKRWDINATRPYVGFVLDASVFAKVFNLFN